MGEFGGFLKVPSGFYRGRILSREYIPFGIFGSTLVSIVWKGTQFNADSTCNTVLRWPFSWFIGNEIGNVCVRKSVLDNKQCINVSFSDRFYEMRVLDNGMTTGYISFLSVVRKIQKDENNEFVPLDIHTLTGALNLNLKKSTIL